MHPELDVTIRKRAQRLVSKKFTAGLSRKVASQQGKITSQGTRRDLTDSLCVYLTWRACNGLRTEQQDNAAQIRTFLAERSEIVRQATLNQNRNALQLAFAIKLPMIRSQIKTCRTSRSYSPDEIARVIEHQSEKNALSTLIAFFAGLRAHELATLRRSDESQPSARRQWDSRRFAGLNNVTIYIVTGKGGLRRQVALPATLAKALECRRLETPQRVVDREIFYDRYYDIGFGQAFSQSFTEASKAGLRFSHGAHGLRHAYAKTRTKTLCERGFALEQAQLIVSQELGHFRPSITIAYYR